MTTTAEGFRLDPELQAQQTLRIIKRYIDAACRSASEPQGRTNARQRYEIAKRMIRGHEFPEAVVLQTVATLADQRALTKINPEHFERSVRYQMDYLYLWFERYAVDAGSDPHDGDEV